MKAKVVIENGKTTIELTPENNFEERVLEDSYSGNTGLDIKLDKTYESYQNEYSIRIEITEGK